MYATETLTEAEARELMRQDLANHQRHIDYLRDLIAKAEAERSKYQGRADYLALAIDRFTGEVTP